VWWLRFLEVLTKLWNIYQKFKKLINNLSSVMINNLGSVDATMVKPWVSQHSAYTGTMVKTLKFFWGVASRHF
jgi:hypothetical protein